MCGSIGARANGAWGVRESVTDLLRHSLPAKGGNRGCWSGCLWRSAAETQTDRRASTFSLIGPGTRETVELGTIGLDVDIGPKQSAYNTDSVPLFHPRNEWNARNGWNTLLFLNNFISFVNIPENSINDEECNNTGEDSANNRHCFCGDNYGTCAADGNAKPIGGNGE